MKTVILPLLVSLSLIILTSCTVFTNKGKSALAEEKSRQKITQVDQKLSANAIDRINAIAGLSFGIDYALSKIQDPSIEVSVAKDINKRVASITGAPTIEKMKEMQQTIDDLTSKLANERADGIARLNVKDAEIMSLQNETISLNQEKQTEIQKYMSVAQTAAAQADGFKGQLDKMDSWFGLGAVFYGLKKFIVSWVWILSIGAIVFFVLRLAAGSNPICAAIFSIFEQVVAWFVKAVAFVFPKALAFAGNVSQKVYDTSHDLLTKIVDNIQNLKQLEDKSGHDLTVKELLVELDKSMDQSEKDLVATIRKDLGY